MPGRRVWTTLGGTAAAVAVIAGATTVAARLDNGEQEPVAAPAPESEQPAEPLVDEPAEETEEPEPEEEEEEEPAEETEEQAPPPPADEEPPAEEPEEEPAEPPADEEPAEPPAQQDDEPAEQNQPVRVTGPTGLIRGLAEKCAESNTYDPAPGTELHLWDCNGTERQQWTVASDGTLRVQGHCLSLAGGATADGTRVVLATCDPTQAIQRWRIERAAGDIVNVVADRCLDVANANTSNGTPLQIANCSGNPAQKWTAP
ncbi:RICIN domain-containing protein [Streptomyces millisiae]|uniref:RICIN domain-containing protein n=1 Tax=Streptomyces millisiae TaxID=3075542 RepID=A0ABU2LJC8_9ACTN|nr:RICIN domain-containing protein [Streptomyces sp. DSM 44918]MDT0317700.1 RICIN domain-containing protein [Streptomyces sp. DSM 44918]